MWLIKQDQRFPPQTLQWTPCLFENLNQDMRLSKSRPLPLSPGPPKQCPCPRGLNLPLSPDQRRICQPVDLINLAHLPNRVKVRRRKLTSPHSVAREVLKTLRIENRMDLEAEQQNHFGMLLHIKLSHTRVTPAVLVPAEHKVSSPPLNCWWKLDLLLDWSSQMNPASRGRQRRPCETHQWRRVGTQEMRLLVPCKGK